MLSTNKKLIYIISIGIFFFILIFLFSLNDGNDCLKNPLTYGAEKMSTTDTGNFSCSCSFTNLKYGQVYFDRNNISVQKAFRG